MIISSSNNAIKSHLARIDPMNHWFNSGNSAQIDIFGQVVWKPLNAEEFHIICNIWWATHKYTHTMNIHIIIIAYIRKETNNQTTTKRNLFVWNHKKKPDQTEIKKYTEKKEHIQQSTTIILCMEKWRTRTHQILNKANHYANMWLGENYRLVVFGSIRGGVCMWHVL